MRAQQVSYTLVEGAKACHEIRFPKCTPPFKAVQAPGERDVATYPGCYYEIHIPGETGLYFTVACPTGDLWRVEEKYAVDLQDPTRVQRLADSLWDSAYALQRFANPLFPRRDMTALNYRGLVFAHSAPAWAGLSVGGEIPAFPGPMGTRLAVNSWSGVTMGTEYTSDVHGDYWIDIYDTGSGRGLVRIKGTFKDWAPRDFQGAAAWYTDRYYVIPLEVEGPVVMGSRRPGMRRALVCDLDADLAGSSDNLKGRK